MPFLTLYTTKPLRSFATDQTCMSYMYCKEEGDRKQHGEDIYHAT
jgi:hypothetical protein